MPAWRLSEKSKASHATAARRAPMCGTRRNFSAYRLHVAPNFVRNRRKEGITPCITLNFTCGPTTRVGSALGALLAFAAMCPRNPAQGPAAASRASGSTTPAKVRSRSALRRAHVRRVVWLKNPTRSPRAASRSAAPRSWATCSARPNNTWEAGWIYNPEDEERFSAEIKLKNDNTLLVTGYLGIKLLGETFTWKRATDRPGALRGQAARSSVRGCARRGSHFVHSATTLSPTRRSTSALAAMRPSSQLTKRLACARPRCGAAGRA